MDSSFFRVVRFIRLLRALRGIRVIRIIHYVGSLRTLVWLGVYVVKKRIERQSE